MFFKILVAFNSSNKGSGAHKVLSLDEQEWRLGLDANKGVPHPTSNKPRTEANVVS